VEAKDIIKKYDAAKKDRSEWDELWSKYLSKFDGRLLYKKDEWQSDVSIPELYKGVTRMVARELKQYWGRKFWELEPVMNDDMSKAAAKKKDRLLEIQLMGHRGRMKKWFRFATWKYLFGPGIVKLFWGDGQPTFDVIDPRLIFPEPGAETVEEAEYIIHEAIVSKDYVRKMVADGVFTVPPEGDTLDVMLAGQGDEPKGFEKENRDKSQKANLLEYWQDDRVVVVLNKKWIVRDEPNPFEHGKKPFLFNVCLDSWNAIWGSGLGWNVYNLYDKLDRHTNMRLDLARLKLNPPVWKGAGAGVFTEGVVKVSPGKVFPVTRINELMPFNMDGALEANNVAVEILRNEGKDTTAITDYVQGASTPSMADTAGATATMSQAADERVQLYLMQNDDFAVRFIEMWLSLNEQFLHEETTDPLTGEPNGYEPIPLKVKSRDGISVEELTKDDVTAQTDIIIKTPNMQPNKLAAQQNAIQLFGILKGDPSIDHKEQLKALLDAFELDVDAFMLDDKEKVKNAIEQMALQQAIQQAIAPPAPTGMEQAPGNMVQADMMNNQAATSNQEAPNGM